MKFMADENVDIQIVDQLRKDGHHISMFHVKQNYQQIHVFLDIYGFCIHSLTRIFLYTDSYFKGLRKIHIADNFVYRLFSRS